MSDVDTRSGAVPVMRVPATPLFANDGGDIFGGWIMAQVDIAGSVPAVQRARGRVVTVAVNSLQFLRPVFVGDMVSLYAEVVQTGNTSLTVDIEVFADRNPAEPERVRVCEARLTYVAVDQTGQPREVPTRSG
jgi:acyl-CoA thioesterase YciA